jgi:hypothetical protein
MRAGRARPSGAVRSPTPAVGTAVRNPACRAAWGTRNNRPDGARSTARPNANPHQMETRALRADPAQRPSGEPTELPRRSLAGPFAPPGAAQRSPAVPIARRASRPSRPPVPAACPGPCGPTAAQRPLGEPHRVRPRASRTRRGPRGRAQPNALRADRTERGPCGSDALGPQGPPPPTPERQRHPQWSSSRATAAWADARDGP